MFFSALIAENCTRQALCPAIVADFFFCFFHDLFSASGAEFCAGSDVFAAIAATGKDHLLVTALGTEFCVQGNLIFAFRAGCGQRGLVSRRYFRGRHLSGKYAGQHHAKA